ncbi:MAG: DUF4127 family protein [Roseiflexaceae bacterium]|nr:DUF4127 family protein [Roseiflexaceae bacterium]
MRIGLIPLDERPVNTRHPMMIARIAGVELAMPPFAILSKQRTPANCVALAEWLQTEYGRLDALIVDLEMLAFGGLIASRTTTDPLAIAIARLDLLRELRATHPALPLLAFQVITRISNADDSIEEPLYWATYGTRLYRFSQLSDRALRGEAVQAQLAALRAEIPAEHMHDFLWRRHRNHTLNAAALHMLADGIFDLFVLSSDDTSAYGLGTREKAWLAELAGRLGLLDDVSAITSPVDQLLMYPGADEVGCVLLARQLNTNARRTPRIAPIYDDVAGAEITAPYEDGPARITIERQIRAVGGVLAAPDDADLVLAVVTPVPRRSEWSTEFAEAEREQRLPQLRALSAEIVRRVAIGQRVIVADIAYPNGADPVFFEVLRDVIDLRTLAGYGAWNTAGNTIGTALAQGCAALDATTPERKQAAEQFLLHHYLEDWGYQQVVRRQARDWLMQTIGHDDPTPELVAETASWIGERLSALIAELPGFAGRWRLTNTRLPWNRTFEVDFDLERHEY